jgi:hypothetical protein
MSFGVLPLSALPPLSHTGECHVAFNVCIGLRIALLLKTAREVERI